MIIDWFTVIAQMFNFLILVWLMKRFLYQPILHAIDEREKRIAAELASADKQQIDAQKERDEFERKNREFDEQRDALLKKATEEARTERQRLLEESRQAAAALSSNLQETLSNEERKLHQAIRHRTQQEVFAIVRKALADLAGASLEERMVDMFVRRLRELGEAEKHRLSLALKKSDILIVRTALELLPAQRPPIEVALKECLGMEIPVRFETAPDLIGGLELITNGQKMAWSIADYLESLENNVEEILKEQDKTEGLAGPIPEASKLEGGQ